MKAEQYDLITRSIHWLSAFAIIGLFALGLWMVELNYYSDWYRTAPHWHKSIGILVAILTIVRLVWKRFTTHPEIEGKRYEVVAAKAAHHTLYLLLFVLFVSGYMISTADGRSIDVFDWFAVPGAGEFFPNQADIAGQVHFYVACTVIGLASLHALAALKHHFINKDNTLRKMLGVKGK
ncbi:cytochrome b [Thaumasiovibrio subtropicus]|uniref:cytochrome b n=1 Tax=Thaumasiovibrio subtropicus TaxID=1891207 RepID=UPI000B35B0B1|nr:cytochrome b [Thaumasiovibrio subtropicus]